MTTKITNMTTNKILCLLAIVSVISFSSCSKDDDDTVVKKEYTGIYFMDMSNEDIETLPIAGGAPAVLTPNVSGVGIAYDKANEKIYYSVFSTDEDNPNGQIVKMNTDGSGSTTIATGITDPYGIAIDSKNKKIYWGDDAGKVSRCNLDGTGKEDIVTIEDGGIRAVAIDETHSQLYFYEANNNNLYKANLDGTKAAVILSGYYGYAICVDEQNNKIYFDAQDDNLVSGLYRANLDGTNMLQIDNTQSKIYGIALDTRNKKVYWSGRNNSEIYGANLNGTYKKTLAKDLGSPRGIFLKY